MKVVISKSIVSRWFTQKISLKSVHRRKDQVTSEKSCDNSRYFYVFDQHYGAIFGTSCTNSRHYTTCHIYVDYISFHKISGRSSRASTFKGSLSNAFCNSKEFYLPRQYLLLFSWDNVLALTRIKLQSIRRTQRNHAQQGHKNKRCHFGFPLWNSYCWACCWRWMISS